MLTVADLSPKCFFTYPRIRQCVAHGRSPVQDIRRIDRVWINGLYGSGKAKAIDIYAQGTGEREVRAAAVPSTLRSQQEKTHAVIKNRAKR